MAMKNPSYPGLTVRHDCLEPHGLTVTEGAKALGVTRQTLNNLLNGKSGISPEMAVRLAKAFGSSAETWARIQLDYDLAQVRRRENEISVRRVKRPAHQTSNQTQGVKVRRKQWHNRNMINWSTNFTLSTPRNWALGTRSFLRDTAMPRARDFKDIYLVRRNSFIFCLRPLGIRA